MLSHVVIGVSDFDRAFEFYQSLMSVLGVEERFVDRERPWAGWQSSPEPRPLFIIARPFDGLPHSAGNGHMTALAATSRRLVDDAYATALAKGATSEGAPGLRPEYHENYYGAYFRDTEGNKICVVCHSAPNQP